MTLEHKLGYGQKSPICITYDGATKALRQKDSVAIDRGFYLAWTREGDQLWFTSEIAIDHVGFDLQQLRLKTVDYEGDTYLVQVFYGDTHLVNTEPGTRWSEPEIAFIAVKHSTRRVSGWKQELY